VKTIKLRIFGLINTIITGVVTGFVLGTYFTGLEAGSQCEYCSMMIYPAILFFLLLLPGVFTLFCTVKTLNKRKKTLNVINIIAILVSASAIVINFMASPHSKIELLIPIIK